MTPEQFLQWIDKEIEWCHKFSKSESMEKDAKYWEGATSALEESKRQFLTIEYPQQENIKP